MREKRTRIVCEVVTVDYFSVVTDKTYKRDVWQEVFSSPYRIDCVKWIETQTAKDRLVGNNRVYHIFVSDQ